jgi:hypothetical protein
MEGRRGGWWASATPGAFLLCALMGSVAFVGVYVQNDSMETVLLQRGVRQQLAGGAGAAKAPFKEGEEPPFDESTKPPPPVCDIKKLQDCLGSLQADKKARPEAHDVAGGEYT